MASYYETSTTLQQEMFLRASPSPRSIPVDHPVSLDHTTCHDGNIEVATEHVAQPVRALLNPLSDLFTGLTPSIAGSTSNLPEPTDDQTAISSTPAKFRGSPSWHRMYLTMSPRDSAEMALW